MTSKQQKTQRAVIHMMNNIKMKITELGASAGVALEDDRISGMEWMTLSMGFLDSMRSVPGFIANIARHGDIIYAVEVMRNADFYVPDGSFKDEATVDLFEGVLDGLIGISLSFREALKDDNRIDGGEIGNISQEAIPLAMSVLHMVQSLQSDEDVEHFLDCLEAMELRVDTDSLAAFDFSA